MQDIADLDDLALQFPGNAATRAFIAGTSAIADKLDELILTRMSQMTGGAGGCFRASLPLTMHRSRAAFTFMELMLAIALAVAVLALSIPVLGGIFGGRELEETFGKFETFVAQAQAKAVKEQRTFLIVWHDEGGLTLEPQIPSAEDAEAELPVFAYGDAELVLERPFALEAKPIAEWPFWRSGTCEPVRVIYKGKEGRWVAEFDALTARGRVVEMEN